MRYLMIVSYDGSKFYGFQRQKQLRSVQKTIEEALSKLLNTNTVVKGSGRTDAGVHAFKQSLHFDCDKNLNHHFKKQLNLILQPDINVKKIKRVSNTFHARHNALKKHYLYKINLGDYKKVYEGYVYQPKFKISISKLNQIKSIFIGTYDFHNFVSGKRNDYTTTIYAIKIKQKGSILEIHFYGRSFYRYMVRNLVGAMLDYNKGKVSMEELKKMLTEKNYQKQLTTAPAYGLYLVKVYYKKSTSFRA